MVPSSHGWQLAVASAGMPQKSVAHVQSSQFTDAEIICADTRIRVHRSTLCAAIDVFDALFSSTMAEGASAVYEIQDSTLA